MILPSQDAVLEWFVGRNPLGKQPLVRPLLLELRWLFFRLSLQSCPSVVLALRCLKPFFMYPLLEMCPFVEPIDTLFLSTFFGRDFSASRSLLLVLGCAVYLLRRLLMECCGLITSSLPPLRSILTPRSSTYKLSSISSSLVLDPLDTWLFMCDTENIKMGRNPQFTVY